MLVKKISPEAKLPAYAIQGDAGLDIYSHEEKKILAGEIGKVKTGVAVEIPDGFVGIVKDKGSTVMQGIHCLAGVIDAGYRGEIEIVVINHGPQPLEIKKGQKIAQIIIQRFEKVKIKEAEELSQTARGEKGFGSTGKW